MPDEPRRTTGTLVVGASAAGLACAAQLRRRGLPYEVIEAEERVGEPWRSRYDRLHLHTPKQLSGLPGLPMPRSYPRYPSRDQLVTYLEQYVVFAGLEPHLDERALEIVAGPDGWRTTTTRGAWLSRNVIVATGRTRVPVLPRWAGLDGFGGEILHSSAFRNGERWRGRTVLVVGFGNSAAEQALDLLEHGARPHLCVRSAVNVVPRDLLGAVPVLRVAQLLRPLPPPLADLLSWPVLRLQVGDLRRLGLRRLPYGPLTQIARDGRIPLLDLGTVRAIRDGRLPVHGAVERVLPGGVQFADGTQLSVEAMLFGTGYRPAVEGFLPAWQDVCDQAGMPRTSGGPSELPGLYFCGMDVAPTGMLGAAGREARRIARAIAARTPRESDASR